MRNYELIHIKRKLKQQRLAIFSIKALIIIFIISLLSNIIANNKPLFILYKHHFFFPTIKKYSFKTFNYQDSDFIDYKNPNFKNHIHQRGYIIWSPIKYSFNTLDYYSNQNLPYGPNKEHLLGVNQIGQDIFAQILYGTKSSLIFALVASIISITLGTTIGIIQGYLSGKTDILTQRVVEIYNSIPFIYLLIFLISLFQLNFIALTIMVGLLSWSAIVQNIRAESLSIKSSKYLLNAKILGLKHHQIIIKYILPQATKTILALFPLIFSGFITIFATLDFISPIISNSTPTLGTLLRDGYNNINSPHIILSAIFTISLINILLIFIANGLNNALNTKTTKKNYPNIPNINLPKYRTINLIGKNGSGKTSLAMSLANLNTYSIFNKASQANKDCSFVFANSIESFNPTLKIIHHIKDLPFKNKKTLKIRALQLLKQSQILNPDQKINQYPHELSSGEIQRIAIILALLKNPRTLILDESFSNLDHKNQTLMINLIKQIQQKKEFNIINITHHIHIAKAFGGECILLTNNHQITKPFNINNNQLPSTNFFKPQISQPTPLKGNPKIIMNIKDLNLTIKKHHILQDISFNLLQGQTLAIIGESGSGKTSLLNCLLKINKFTGYFNSLYKPQVIFQNPQESFNPKFTIRSLLQEQSKKTNSQIKQALNDVNLSATILNKYPHQLSSGELQKVGIAKTIINNPKVIIMDEITSNLDKASEADILRILKLHQLQHQTSYIFASHNSYAIKSFAHSIIELNNGYIKNISNNKESNNL